MDIKLLLVGSDNMQNNFGLITSLIKDFDAYVFGSSSIPTIEINESGNWEPYLPKYEAQKDKFESYGCTLWGLHNQIETQYKFLYGKEPNYDEWFNYPLIPIRLNGQDPHVTYESVRSRGLIDAGTVDVPDTRLEALDTKNITGTMYAKGQNWLMKHEFLHEWLWSTKPENYLQVLKKALKTCPIAVSVSAWNLQNGVYVSTGDVNNHFCLLYKFDEQGYPWVFDTYDHSRKKLSIDHNIRRAKRIWIHRRDISGMKKEISLFTRILNALLMKKTLLDICKTTLGKDASPRDLTADSTGCAESVTTLLKQIYPETPIITGTYSLFEWLQKNWKETTVATPECILISHTGSGNGSMRGHVGILDENLNVMSNDSATGKWMTNYSLETWRKRYVEKGGFKMRYFTKIK